MAASATTTEPESRKRCRSPELVVSESQLEAKKARKSLTINKGKI